MRPKLRSRSLLTPEDFLSGVEIPDDRFEAFDRVVDLDAVEAMIAEAQRRFAGGKPELSDAWLAPRLHATLRLFRREAADKSIWQYLSIRFRGYVAWRWKTDRGIAPERIAGGTNRNALARLWWAAEILRDGSAYDDVANAFRLQETVQWILDIDAFHNRAAALAFVRQIPVDGTGDMVRLLAKKLNHVLTTLSLDTLANNLTGDPTALEHWINESPDETLMYAELPVGPDEPRVPESEVAAMEQVLVTLRLAAKAP